MPHQQPLEDSTATTPCDHYTTTTIKDNTHDKYATMKHANMFTLIWLLYMCKKLYLINMVLFYHSWHLSKWSSSIHSSSNFPHNINKDFQQQNYLNWQTLTIVLQIQPNFERFQEIKGKNSKLLSKSQLESYFNFIGGVRTRQTPRKARTLHKVAFSIVYTCT